MLPVIAPVAANDVDISPNFIGYYTSVMLIGATFSTLVTTGFVHRFGALRVSQATLIFAGFGLAIVPLATLPYAVYPVMLISALLIGIAYGPANPSSSHLLVKLAPSHVRGRVLSIKQAAIPAGGATAGFAIPALEHFIGWKSTSLIVAVACIALAFLLQPWRRICDVDLHVGTPLRVTGISTAISLFKQNQGLRLLAAASGAFAATQFCFIALFVTVAVTTTSYDLQKVGLALSIGMTVSIGGRIFWGWVADYFEPRAVLGLLGLFMSICSFTSITLGPDWHYWGLVALSIGFGCSGTSWQGVYLTEVARIAPRDKVTEATSCCMAATFLGGLIGPGIAAIMTEISGNIAGGFVLIGAITLVFGIVYITPYKH